MDKREMTESQLKNLIPFDNSPQGKERASRAGKTGNKESRKKRKQNKDFKTIVKTLLESPLTEQDLERIESLGYSTESLSQWGAMVISLLEEAKNGNTRAFEQLAKVAGVNAEQSPVSVNIGTDSDRVQIYLPEIEPLPE